MALATDLSIHKHARALLELATDVQAHIPRSHRNGIGARIMSECVEMLTLIRRNAKKVERVGRGLWIMRPIVEWTAEQVFALAQAKGIKPNPLYLQGMTRVGCMPCINVNKRELRAIALRFPLHPLRIADWERVVGMCSKRGFSTFMADAHPAADRRQVFADLNIWARIEWSKTTRGGRQFDLLQVLDESATCSSAYGLCE